MLVMPLLLTAVGVLLFKLSKLLLVVCKTQEAAQRGATTNEVKNAALQCRASPQVLINQCTTMDLSPNNSPVAKKKCLGTPSCACGAPSSARRKIGTHIVAREHLNAQGRPSGSIVGVTGHCYWHKLAIKVRQRSTSQQPSRSLSRSLFQTPSVDYNIVSIDKHSQTSFGAHGNTPNNPLFWRLGLGQDIQCRFPHACVRVGVSR